MDNPTMRALALAPWLQALQQPTPTAQPADGIDRSADGSIDDEMARRAWRVLQGLLQSDAAPVPAWIEATEHLRAADGGYSDLRPRERLDEICRDRESVLTLGLCAALQRWVDALGGEYEAVADGATDTGCATKAGSVFARLMTSISRPGRALPAVLRPSLQHGGGGLGFASSAAATDFVEHHLRPCLVNLAELYDGAGAAFGRWARLPPYRGHGIALALWSRAWCVAVTAVWLDWMNHAADGRFAPALDLVRQGHPHRFTPLPRVRHAPADAPAGCEPTALPSKSRELQFDLLADIVVAQVLCHDPARWAALEQGQQRFAVALATKTLDQRASERLDPVRGVRRHVTQYRQITLKQVYMAVVMGCCDWPLHLDTPAPPAPQPRSQRRPRASHAASARELCDAAHRAQRPLYEELVKAQSLMATLRTTRPRADQQPPWAVQRQGRAADESLSAGAVWLTTGARLGWQPTSASAWLPSDGVTTGGVALGSLDPVSMPAAQAQWLQASLLLHLAGRWMPLTLQASHAADEQALREVRGTGRSDRVSLHLPAQDLRWLSDRGVNVAQLPPALEASGGGTWALRRAGTGVLLAGLVDLGWSPRA